MKGRRENEWGEGVVLGLVAIRRPVSSPRSRGVFVVWARVVPSFCVLVVVSSSCVVVVARTSFVVGVSRRGHGGCGVVWLRCGGMVVVFVG